MIHLDGVAVPQVDEEYLDFNPYDHQAEAQRIIKNKRKFFAVNTSPTGSGKTYSWLKPALDEGIDTIAVFPTNALIADQFETAQELAKSSYSNSNVVEITGESVAKWRDEYRSVDTKGEALRRRLDQALRENRATIALTNPDVFTLMRKDMYRHTDVSGLPNQFGMLVFDEFHLADIRQTDLLLFLVDELNELPDTISRAKRFYFLSATPDDSTIYRSVEERISEDIRQEVNSVRAEAVPLSQADKKYKGVMPRVNLALRETQIFKTGEKLLQEESFDEFVEFCEEEQTVIMLDGVHEVDEVYSKLSEETDVKVHRITGFNDEKARKKIKNFDVLVSNSAVEVGLDFQPERLVFSAANTSTLIQRLGRLRKLSDRNKPHDAWCYVPKSVKAKIEIAFDDKRYISRSEFKSSVRRIFDDEIDLSSYSKRWSDIEAYHHVSDRAEDVPSDERDRVLKEGLRRIERHYYEPFGKKFEKKDLDRLLKTTSKEFVEELKTYRGSGLQVMVRDLQTDEMKLYNMLHLLRWGELCFYKPSEFCSRLTSKEERFYRAYKDYSVGFCDFSRKLPSDDSDEYSGRNVKFKSGNNRFHRMIEQKDDRTRKPDLLSGLDIKIDMNNTSYLEGIDHLRDQLKEAERLVYTFPGSPSSNEAFYGFGNFFFVYPFFRRGGDCSITFGNTALYMHCLVQDRVENKTKERDWSWD